VMLAEPRILVTSALTADLTPVFLLPPCRLSDSMAATAAVSPSEYLQPAASTAQVSAGGESSCWTRGSAPGVGL